ncbi:hypothetical protein HW555_011969 [Spodoptera exigua]|uniref:Uncharacterized protein n=1 Tax=Spodoptera exigua TaxID=7107 RepID=A0A835G800_SPOEX|nr:hypothetical protein HW555_011969 [Spodoptera exigua]
MMSHTSINLVSRISQEVNPPVSFEGYFSRRGFSSSIDTILWRLPSEALIMITPSCDQQERIPKCCRALVKMDCLVFVRNSLTEILVPLKPPINVQHALGDLLSEQTQDTVDKLPECPELLRNLCYSFLGWSCSLNLGSKLLVDRIESESVDGDMAGGVKHSIRLHLSFLIQRAYYELIVALLEGIGKTIKDHNIRGITSAMIAFLEDIA